MSNIRVVEFYCGIGGLHRAFARCRVQGEVVAAYDWDQAACKVYGENYGSDIIKKTDIATLTANGLATLRGDLWMMSPSCQPYTVLNPKAKGVADPRAKSFLHLVENVLPELVLIDSHPTYLLVENVAGFENSSTRQTVLSVLQSLRYSTMEFLLNPIQFDIPNSRLRYYLLAKAFPLGFGSTTRKDIRRCIPPMYDQNYLDSNQLQDRAPAFPTATNRSTPGKISVYLDPDGTTPGSTFLVPEMVLIKWGQLFDIVTRISSKVQGQYCRRMKALTHTSKVFKEFFKVQSIGEVDPVKILRPLKLRYFSPSELMRLFCFEPHSATKSNEFPTNETAFRWPADVSRKTKYKLIGNSVNVKVVEELLRFLLTS